MSAAAQAHGDVDVSLDPAFVVLSFMSLVSWFVAAPQIANMVIGDTTDPHLLARYRAHLVELSRRILARPVR